VVMYISEGIISRIGDPDQSLIFWYLPLLFAGIIILTAGIVLFINSYEKIKVESRLMGAATSQLANNNKDIFQYHYLM